MAETSFDLAVIGGGPGGYVAAIRGAQLGMKTAIVDIRDKLGGTCLNVGCIPSKALLHTSHLYEAAAHEYAEFGIKAQKVALDLKKMMEHKAQVVDATVKGVDFLMNKNKITKFVGTGSITAKGEIAITPAKGNPQKIKATNIIIATGSSVAPLPGVEMDEKRIVSSTGGLELDTVPKEMIVVGAGVIGLELGSVWRRLGAKVTVIEFLDHILPGMDGELAKQAQRLLKSQGMDFKLSSKVTGAKSTKTKVTLNVEPVSGGKAEQVSADIVLVAIGRRPYTEGLGLEKVGVVLTDRGFIKVDDHFRTSVEGIYAIGDVIGGAMLAHKAEEEGSVVAEIIDGQAGHIDYDAMPAIVYTHPEIAGLGKTEEQLKKDAVDYSVGKFPFTANARARAMGETDGFVKILADAHSDEILGVHIIGPQAGDLIQEAVIAMEFGGSAEDVARSCHGHPGLSEVVKEAALAVGKRALHI